nr:coiled-coil domain-containing protein 81-like [Anas platyrhynchos]
MAGCLRWGFSSATEPRLWGCCWSCGTTRPSVSRHQTSGLGVLLEVWDHQTHCDQVFLCFPEQTDVWNAVANYVLQQLLQYKGVRIPTLGSFDIIQKRIQAGDKAMIFQWPVFHLATNLINTHHLEDSNGSLPAHKKLEPLRRAEVAADACVSWQKAESCIRGTMALISQCLREGENVALVLRDLGVLLIEGTRVEMKFYYDVLEMLCGKEDLQNAVLKVPQLMDTVVSRLAVIASLTSSGRVVIFPEFAVELVPKSSYRKSSKAPEKLPGKEKKKKDGVLPPLSQGKKASGGLLDMPFTVRASIPKHELQRLKETAQEDKKESGIR